MSFRKLKRGAGLTRSLPDKIIRRLQKADEWVEDHEWEKAYDVLSELNEAHPNRIEIVTPLAIACYNLQETAEYLDLCIQLDKLTPNNPDNKLALASAYLMNQRYALAHRTAGRFLERWPHHKEVENARKMHLALDLTMKEVLKDIGLSGDEALDIAALHEESQILMEQGKFDAAITKAEEVLRREPDVKAAHNNLSLMHFYRGGLAKAIEHAEQALKLRDNDYHALGNLAHFLFVAGREDEARRYVERLKQVEETIPERFLKQAEACATIGDHRGVLDAMQHAREIGGLEKEINGHLFYHLAAVAEWRLGRKAEARALWRESLKIAPSFDPAQENLSDSLNAAHEQNGPWYFPLNHWLPQKTIGELMTEVKKAAGRDGKAINRKTREFLEKHPEVLRQMKHQLEDGDPDGRFFAYNVALMAKSPETLAMLRDFALGQKGPDELRLRAVHVLREQEFLPESEMVRFWLRGDWAELRFQTTKVTFEPSGKLPEEANALMQEAHERLMNNDGDKAEPLLKKALEIAPDSTTLLNNLAMAYALQKRNEEADRIVRQLFTEHPDYFFGRVGMANIFIREGKYDKAEEILNPLHAAEELHISEATVLYASQADLNLRRGNRKEAERWLSMLEKMDPENRNLAALRSQLRKSSLDEVVRRTLNR